MPNIRFTHPKLDSTLTINTGANDIAWSYTLNTATYPTYAGEVVQVLSTAIENLTISGEVRSVAEMERVYRWFLDYMQKATQGTDGVNYTEIPVKMMYPERGWTLYIQPIGLPGLHYGRDIVVPTWQLQAHIIDPDPKMRELTISSAIELDDFRNTLTADIGFRESNPYSDPLGVINHDEAVLFDWDGAFEGQKADEQAKKAKKKVEDTLTGAAKHLSDQLEKYVQGNFEDFTDAMKAQGVEASKPADPQTQASTKSDHEKKVDKKHG